NINRGATKDPTTSQAAPTTFGSDACSTVGKSRRTRRTQREARRRGGAGSARRDTTGLSTATRVSPESKSNLG
ncbi:hypothetical protein Dimus_013277, partial [Dionaea muscipula]